MAPDNGAELESRVSTTTQAKAGVLKCRTLSAPPSVREIISADMRLVGYPQDYIDGVMLAITTAYENIYRETYLKEVKPLIEIHYHVSQDKVTAALYGADQIYEKRHFDPVHDLDATKKGELEIMLIKMYTTRRTVISDGSGVLLEFE